jgi:hypothetical protein
MTIEKLLNKAILKLYFNTVLLNRPNGCKTVYVIDFSTQSESLRPVAAQTTRLVRNVAQAPFKIGLWIGKTLFS